MKIGCEGFANRSARHFQMNTGYLLIGGDTTKGTALSITVQVMGEVNAGKAILRSNAKAGQLVFVSGDDR